jgi:hypothetical protein
LGLRAQYADGFDEWFDGRSEEAGGAWPGFAEIPCGHSRGSRHSNSKELGPLGTNIGVPFTFDPRRMAILLIGGDKTDRWSEFYEEMIPVADHLYDEHLDELRKEGKLL